jgi:hypothetical protein
MYNHCNTGSFFCDSGDVMSVHWNYTVEFNAAVLKFVNNKLGTKTTLETRVEMRLLAPPA